MSDWKRLERVELDDKSNEELQSLIQQNVSEFKVYLETYEGDLKAFEDQLVQENYEYDETLKDAEYELPEDIEFEGGHYSRSEIGNIIIYLLNKMEVKFSETLGMHEMVQFWKNNPTTIKHTVLDSILRILQTLSFNGDKEWIRILAVNAYIQNKLQQKYVANVIYVHYGAYLHDELVKFIEGEQNNTPETPDTEIPETPVVEECEVVAIAGEGGSVEKEYQKIVFGTSVTLKATPNGGYEFYGWYVDGVCVSTSQEYTTTIYSDMRYIADFDIIIPDTEIPEETPTE